MQFYLISWFWKRTIYHVFDRIRWKENIKCLLILFFSFFFYLYIILVRSWNIFLLITAVVPLLAGILHMFFPESPKYLMSQGRNNEALKSIAIAYAINRRSTKASYPVGFFSFIITNHIKFFISFYTNHKTKILKISESIYEMDEYKLLQRLQVSQEKLHYFAVVRKIYSIHRI